eukprot:GILJ01013274.1.p1 GENE.GILJ01013274.1~~GILJ01013274.1.p1  ORF type:complete len:628 (-),score=50.03 GILJ01013274.1:383-2098(-)
MTIINKVTALTHLSKLRNRFPEAFKDPVYFALVADVKAGMFAGGRVMSTAFNTLSRLQEADQELMQKVATYSIAHVERMSPRDLSTIVHCFGVAGFRSELFLQTISQHLVSKTSLLSTTDVAFLLWGLGQLRYRHDALIDALLRCVDKDMGQYPSGGLATICWSLAVLQRPDRELVSSILQRLVPCLDMVKWSDTCLLIWACAAMQIEVTDTVIRVAYFLDSKTSSLTTTQIITVLWSAVALGIPWEKQSRGLMSRFVHRVQEITALDYSYLIWAYGQQQCYQQTFVMAMANRALHLLPTMAPSHIVNTIFGYTQLRYLSEPFFDALYERFSESQWKDLSTAQLITVLRGQTTLNYDYEPFFESLISELLARNEQLDAVQFTEVAFALCLFNQFGNGTRWMRVMHKLSNFPPGSFSSEAAQKMEMLLKAPELMRFGRNFSGSHLIHFAAEWSKYKETISCSPLANELREALTLRAQQFGSFEYGSDVDLLVTSPPDEFGQSVITPVLLQPAESFSVGSAHTLLGLPSLRTRMLQAIHPNLVVIDFQLWSDAQEADRTLLLRKLFKNHSEKR